MNPLAQSLYDALSVLDPAGCDPKEAERLADVLGSREEVAAYLLLRHESVAKQPLVARALAKRATLGLEVRPTHHGASAFTASHVDIEEARRNLRSALRELIQQDARSQEVHNGVGQRLKDLNQLSPPPTLQGFLDRIAPRTDEAAPSPP
jgi:hypothetical protein